MHTLKTSGWAALSARYKATLLQGMVVLACWAMMSFTSVYAVALKDIQFSGLPGNKVQIELALDAAPAGLKSFSTDNPARVAIDLEGVSNGAGKSSIPINIGKAISVRALEAGGKTRVVLSLSDSAPYSTKVVGNSVFLTLGNVSNNSQVASKTLVSATSASGKAVRNVDFRRGEEGEGRILVSLSDASAVVDLREEAGKVIVDIKNTRLPPELANRLDVLDFATPVKTIDVMAAGNDTRLSITGLGEYEFLSYQMDELLTVEFKPLTKQQQHDLASEKFPYTGEKLSLNFQSIEVRSVLQLLADFTNMNLVASDSVGGNVTLRLNNVPWDQALDIILKSNGLAKRIIGNVMMVGPQAEVAAQEKLELEAKKQVKELSPLVSEFFEVSYAKAADLVKILKSTSGNRSNDNNAKLISDRGGVSVDIRTNTLLVQETAEKLVEIRRIIERLDRPVRQVMIESRIVIANDDFTRDLGVRFGVAGIDQSNDSISAITGGIDEGFVDTTVGIEDFGGMIVDLPAANPAGAVHFLVGKIGSSLLQLELSALQTEAKGEVISSPRVITSDQIEANISQGVQIPYQEASSSGATSTSFQEAFLELNVTPRITPDDRINLELNISKDEADRSTNPPAINVQKVETTVLVNNGDTVILGGIYERTNTEGTKKVPFFGDLPAVGVLFRNVTKADNNRELLFFITPKILKDNLVIN